MQRASAASPAEFLRHAAVFAADSKTSSSSSAAPVRRGSVPPFRGLAPSPAVATSGHYDGGSLAGGGGIGAVLAGALLLRRQRRRRQLQPQPQGQAHQDRSGLKGITGLCAGELPPVLKKTVTKKELKQTITWHLDRHGVDRTRKLLDDMKELGFGWATRAGISLGVDDMMVPAEKASICDGTLKRTLEAQVKYENGEITVVEKFLKVTDEWSRTSEQVKEAAIKNFKENDPNNPVYMMSTSGARGNISQVRQLLAMRGLMADANGQLIDVPIQHCLREGMTVTDMLISGHGARKGVIDTALRTADSGYLYRRMDFAACNVVVRGDDCGTREFMSVNLKGLYSAVAPMKERLRGRVLAAPILDPRNGSLIHDTGHLVKALEADKVASIWKQCEKDGMKDLPALRVRSPLMCKLSQGICAKCYGEDLSTPGKLVVRGHPSGTIAAQSMGEPGTQLTMRTFHTGGAFEGKAGKAAQVRALSMAVTVMSCSPDAVQPSLQAQSGCGASLGRQSLAKLIFIVTLKDQVIRALAPQHVEQSWAFLDIDSFGTIAAGAEYPPVEDIADAAKGLSTEGINLLCEAMNRVKHSLSGRHLAEFLQVKIGKLHKLFPAAPGKAT
ncbi:unnamed protein product [Polarella glacialis]|uniref:DNA-directed RNA polymerase n=1 Tax=Polarella glacialis TaxID=89957 RepID=A0A813LFM3_POLGL|nr:unnamed protein product [Polarella glacialis]